MQYGLIGWPLGHSFSKMYFTEKFIREGISDARYELYPISEIQELPDLLSRVPDLRGLNVTIPYKQSVIPFLDQLDKSAEAVGAVNCIKISSNRKLTGYNTDVIGFEKSLHDFTGKLPDVKYAFILGTGGAAKAVAYVLQKQNIPFHFISRNPKKEDEKFYSFLTHWRESSTLLINCTPLGTYPDTQEMPPVPLEILHAGNLVFDLVYNPAETLLLQHARARGCHVQNGLDMLHHQAEAAWNIWQTES
ncbi:MAG: shikimate dehydrogenase [Saprospiraceae bacterium]